MTDETRTTNARARSRGRDVVAAAAISLAVSCGSGGGATPDAGAPLDADTSPDAAPLAFVGDPEIILNPTGRTPLAARLTVGGNYLTAMQVDVTGIDGSWTLTFDEPAETHEVPLLGFEPDTAYEIDVTLTDVETGAALALPEPLALTTDPLPDAFPELVVESRDPARMEPGLNLFDVAGPRSYLVIVDDEGDVVWFYVLPVPAAEARQLDSGNILFMVSGDLVETDMLGNTVRTYRVVDPGGDPGDAIAVEDPGTGFHHDVHVTAHDTFMALGNEITTVPDFHLSETDPALLGTADVRDDTILEFDGNGTVVNRWALLDILDPTRIGYDSLRGTADDWTHANAVVYDPASEQVIVSARHQDAVFAFGRETGELTWILAPHENWSAAFQPFLLEPVGTPFEWSFHQHAPMLTPDGTLLLFDNGNHRASPYDGTTPMTPEDSYSRAVEYRIDTDDMTIEQVWEYGASIDPRLYASFISDADYLPQTGNVWITFGGLGGIGELSSADMGRGQLQAKLVEVARDDPEAVVFDLAIFSDIEDDAGGWRTYRADRIPSLYPDRPGR